jgi:hypothetical protein
MNKPSFKMEVSFNADTGQPVAAYLRVRDGKVAGTREVSEGTAFADYGADGYRLGVELLAPCSVTFIDSLSERESEPVRRFLRAAVPHELVRA